jgi:hypothetical protein
MTSRMLRTLAFGLAVALSAAAPASAETALERGAYLVNAVRLDEIVAVTPDARSLLS